MRTQTPPNHRKFARQMRNDPTPAEAVLWDVLRGKRLAGMRFRRQHPIEGYIVDFICLNKKLIVEVDGGQHAESLHDIKRDAALTTLGYQVLRFWNDDVLNNSDGVAAEILIASGNSDR